jgi:hypothetical protein
VAIQLDPDEAHVPGLRLAQQVAGSAQVEVARADREARADAVERLQRAQPAFGGRRQARPGLGQQVDHAARAAPPDAAAQLVQLRQAEAVGAPDEHRVGTRHVEPGLHDVGGEQDIALAAGEADHRVVHLGRRQVAMRGR